MNNKKELSASSLKTYNLNPLQKEALALMAQRDNKTYQMPLPAEKVENPVFYFPLYKIHEVSEVLEAGGRPVDWTKADFTEEVIEFDWTWSFEKDTLVLKKIEIQGEYCALTVEGGELDHNSLESAIEYAGYDVDFFNNDTNEFFEIHMDDLRPLIIAQYIISDKDFFADDNASFELKATELLPMPEAA